MIDRELIEVVGIALGLALAVSLSAVFSVAFAYGGSVTIAIDQYGEMWFEAVLLWFVAWPTMTVALHRITQR